MRVWGKIVGLLGVWALLPTLASSAASEINETKFEEFFGTGENPDMEPTFDNCRGRRRASGDERRYSYGTASCWRTCEALLPKGIKWPDVVQKYGQGQGGIAALWEPAVREFIRYRDHQNDGVNGAAGSPYALGQNARSEKVGKEFQQLIEYLYQCHALITVSGHSDYSSDKFRDRKEIYTRTSLINKQLKCQAAGSDTQDYPKCVRLIELYDTFTVAKKAKVTVDVIRYQEHVDGAQDKLHDKRMEGDTVGVADSLNVQKESFKKQKNLSMENMTISAAQMTSLLAIIRSMPTWDSLITEECIPRMKGQEGEYQKLYNLGKERAHEAEGDDDKPDQLSTWPAGPDLKEPCQRLADGDLGLMLIFNTEAREIAKALSVQSGIEAAANLAKGVILNKRIKGIKGAIKDIDEFAPKDLTEEEMEEMYVRECFVNPELPKCKIRQRRKVEGTKNTYTFGSSPGNSVVASEWEDPDAPAVGAGNGDRGGGPSGIGTHLPEGGSSGNDDFESPPPPPGTYAGKGRGLPGGGGGAPGGASPPGKSVPGNSNQNTPSSTGTEANVKYDGSGAGWGGYSPQGSGNNRGRTRAPVANPFAKLFGKDKKKGGSELVEFRNPASKRAGNRGIFRRVSGRYGEAVKGKRLLEYTAEKAD